MTAAWRIWVVTDTGTEATGPVNVSREQADAWLDELGVTVRMKIGGKDASLTPRSAADFTPSGIRTALGADAPDSAIGTVLENPDWKRIESAWRGLGLLAEHAGDEVEVQLFSIPSTGLVDGFREHVHARAMAGDSPALILMDADFSHQSKDLGRLQQLAEMASEMQSVLVGAASATFFDLRFLVQAISLPDLPARLSDSAHAGWIQFQSSDAARWTLLTINRFLQRSVWTQDDGHEESASDSNPDTFLWGRGGWLVAASVARSIGEHGHALAIAGAQGGRFDDMPTRPWATAANVAVPMATEAPLAEMQMLELGVAGFCPVIGPLRTSTVLLPNVLTTFRPSHGKLTLEGTLAYQLAAASLADACGTLLPQARSLDDDSAVEVFRTGLGAALGSLAGESIEDAVHVHVRFEGEGDARRRVADIKVTPQATLEGKPLEFAFALPLS